MIARVLVRIWLIVAVVIAFGLAGTSFGGPDVAAPAGWTLADELALTGSTWVASGLVLMVAAYLADNRVLGWLLVAFAVTSAAHGVAFLVVGYPPASYPSFGTALFSALAAVWLLRHPDGAVMRASARS